MARPKRALTAIAAAVLLVTSFERTAQADDDSRWERVAHSVVELWRSDSSRGAKTWLRHRVVDPPDLVKYGLHCDEGWEQCPSEKPLVVLLHGYNSTPGRNGRLLDAVREANYPCAGFAYPNDHTLARSAALLSRELKEYSDEHPDKHIALITHSMGGLVARECIENPRLDPGNVDRLIMIAPPTHGTMLAHWALCADIWEHGLFRRSGGLLARLEDAVIDGLAEAADDLRPGSAFLQKLNRRPRNPDVEYTMLLGTGGRLQEGDVDAVKRVLRKTAGRLPGLRTTTSRLVQCLSDMDELIAGKGDGAVAIRRALLAGVDDVVVLPFNHLSVTGEPKAAVVRQVHQEILTRLGEK